MKKEVKSENKKKLKRKISIITMFVGILLLFTMGTISLKGLNKTNALEEIINSSNRTDFVKDATSNNTQLIYTWIDEDGNLVFETVSDTEITEEELLRYFEEQPELNDYEINGEASEIEENHIVIPVKLKTLDNGISITKTRKSINGDINKTTAVLGDTIYWDIVIINYSNIEKTITLKEESETNKLNFNTKYPQLSENKITLLPGISKTIKAEYTVLGDEKLQNSKLYNIVSVSTGDEGTNENVEDTDEGTEIIQRTFDLEKTFKGIDEIPEDFEMKYNVICENTTEGTLKYNGILNLSNCELNNDTNTITWKVPYFYGFELNDNSGNKATNIITLTEINADVDEYKYHPEKESNYVEILEDNTILIRVNSMASGITRRFSNIYEKNSSDYTYNLTWDYNGGVVGENTNKTKEVIVKNNSYTFYEDEYPKPQKTGYIFIGWIYSGNGTFTESNGQVNMTGKLGETVHGTLTAQWWKEDINKISWYDEDKISILDTNIFNQGETEPVFSKKLPTKLKDEVYTYKFLQWVKQDVPLNDDDISYVAEYEKILIEYGSYIVKHEYYTRDKDGNIILDKAIVEDEIIMEVGTIIDTNSIERKSENYIFSEISDTITIEKDEQKVITIKYVKDKEEIENNESNDDIDKNINTVDTSDINIWIYIGITIISIIVIVVLIIIIKKNKSK